MRRPSFIISVLVAASAMHQGCSDQTSFVGAALFPKDVNVDSLVVMADSSATYRARLTGNTSTLLLGRYQLQESHLLLQFTVPAGIPETSLVSVELKLIPRYWFRDSTGTLAFTVHRLVKSWSQTTVTFDSLAGLFDASASGSFSASVIPSDTIRATVDTAVVREWMRTGLPYGILLSPTASCNVVYGFTSFVDFLTDIRPVLSYRYVVADSTQSIDTIDVSASQDAFVANGPLVPPSTAAFVAQAGIADRGLLHFTVGSIPPSASITSAILEFTRDLPLSDRNELTADSVFVQLILDNENPPRGGIFVLAEPVGGETGTIFRVEVSRIVQQWVTGQPNYGFAIRPYNEFTALDRFVFFGAADSLNRPRLNVRYSILR